MTLKKINQKRLIKVSRLLFLGYIFLVLYFLLFAESFGRTEIKQDYSYNLTAFKEIKRYIEWAKASDTGFKMMLLNIWGNVLCFVPYGFFIPVLFKKMRHMAAVTIAALGFSVFVETFQLLFKIGSFDIDDIILNTAGGIIGFILYIILKKILKNRIIIDK